MLAGLPRKSNKQVSPEWPHQSPRGGSEWGSRHSGAWQLTGIPASHDLEGTHTASHTGAPAHTGRGQGAREGEGGPKLAGGLEALESSVYREALPMGMC